MIIVSRKRRSHPEDADTTVLRGVKRIQLDGDRIHVTFEDYRTGVYNIVDFNLDFFVAEDPKKEYV